MSKQTVNIDVYEDTSEEYLIYDIELPDGQRFLINENGEIQGPLEDLFVALGYKVKVDFGEF